MISCSTLEDGRVMVSGTLELRKGVMSQMMFLYDDGRMIIKKEPSAGMIGLQMVAIGLNVFFISGQKCEKYNLESNEIVSVEDMNFNHVKGGACKFNNEVLVVSGINCKEIEVFTQNSYWVVVSSMKVSLFEINCVQIGENEVFCVNSRRTYRLVVDSGECICTANYQIDIKVNPALRGPFVFCLNVRGELVRYSLENDKWSNLIRAGCCLIV